MMFDYHAYESIDASWMVCIHEGKSQFFSTAKLAFTSYFRIVVSIVILSLPLYNDTLDYSVSLADFCLAHIRFASLGVLRFSQPPNCKNLRAMVALCSFKIYDFASYASQRRWEVLDSFRFDLAFFTT